MGNPMFLLPLVTAWGAGRGLQPEADESTDACDERSSGCQQGTKRYLSFEVCGGVTNQRLGLLDALMIARATDRVAIMPLMLLNGTQDARRNYEMDHADERVPFRKFFDVPATRKKLGDLVQILEDGPPMVPKRQFSAHSQRNTLDYYTSSFGDAPWIQMDCAYDAVNPVDRAEKRELFWKLDSSLVPAQHISDAAGMIKLLLKARSLKAGADGGYTALHLRVEPDWVEHCRLWEASQQPDGRNCMTNSLVLDRVFLIERVPQKRPVFVAAELTRDDLVAHPGVQRLGKLFSVTSKRGLSGLEAVDGSENDVALRSRSQAVAKLRVALHGASREMAAAIDLEVCKGAELFIGNSVSTFSALELMRRGWICGASCKAQKHNSFHYNGGAMPLVTALFHGGSLLQPRPLKWVFSTSSHSSPDYLMMARVAVDSALNNTDLMPVLLFDGDSGHDIAIWMTSRGVPVICHQPDWLPLLKKSFEASSAGDKAELKSKSPLFGSVEKMAATWMRIDIPQLGFADEFVLYADIDIMFVNDVNVSQFAGGPGMSLPGDGNDLHYIVGTETNIMQGSECCREDRPGEQVAYGNAGVMLLHVARMRATQAEFVAWIFTEENLYKKQLHFGAYGPQDQGAYNQFYQDRFEVRTQPLFNWKPYWGYHAKASLIHFHGPKPSEYLTYAGSVCHPEAKRPIEAIVQLMVKCQTMNNGCMDYIDPWLDFAHASTDSPELIGKLDEMVKSSVCSKKQIDAANAASAAEPAAPAAAPAAEPAAATAAAAPAAEPAAAAAAPVAEPAPAPAAPVAEPAPKPVSPAEAAAAAAAAAEAADVAVAEASAKAKAEDEARTEEEARAAEAKEEVRAAEEARKAEAEEEARTKKEAKAAEAMAKKRAAEEAEAAEATEAAEVAEAEAPVRAAEAAEAEEARAEEEARAAVAAAVEAEKARAEEEARVAAAAEARAVAAKAAEAAAKAEAESPAAKPVAPAAKPAAPAAEPVAPAAHTGYDDQPISMHLITNCNSCGSDWCTAADRNCTNFALNDGKHVLGPNVLKVGCGALVGSTPYCIVGSNDIYGVAKRAPSRVPSFDPTSCVSISPAADTAWCMASCTNAHCPSSSGMCKCGRIGTKGRRRAQPQPQPEPEPEPEPKINDGSWDGDIVPKLESEPVLEPKVDDESWHDDNEGGLDSGPIDDERYVRVVPLALASLSERHIHG